MRELPVRLLVLKFPSWTGAIESSSATANQPVHPKWNHKMSQGRASAGARSMSNVLKMSRALEDPVTTTQAPFKNGTVAAPKDQPSSNCTLSCHPFCQSSPAKHFAMSGLSHLELDTATGSVLAEINHPSDALINFAACLTVSHSSTDPDQTIGTKPHSKMAACVKLQVAVGSQGARHRRLRGSHFLEGVCHV